MNFSSHPGYMGMAFIAVLLLLTALFFHYLWKTFLWRPYVVTQAFGKQGVRGPPYKLWFGSLREIQSIKRAAMEVVLDTDDHDITTRVFPHLGKWIAEYGETFLFWVGAQPLVCVSQAEMVRQVLARKFGFYSRLAPSPEALALVGNGLVYIEGAEWVRHRRVVSPAFSMDKLKLLTKTMADCVELMLQGWQEAAREGKEVEVSQQFQVVTADVISHTAFGSSFKEGKELFLAQKELMKLVAQNFLTVNFPGSRYIPSKRNLQTWKLKKRIRSMFMNIIENRLARRDFGCSTDLLGLLLEAEKVQVDEQKLNMEEIIDECKTFFLAGHETTSHFLTWTMFLLSSNPDWQQKLREEVRKVCGMEVPNADMTSNLKLMNLVLLESLRLYSPIVLLRRKAAKDMILGSIKIMKGTLLMMPISIIHRNKEIWGADVNEFNPLRFEKGITKSAKNPNAFLTFSIGPRACLGQNFAMLEAKMAMAMILRRFSFSLSPNYKHVPIDSATIVVPQYGLPIVLKALH